MVLVVTGATVWPVLSSPCTTLESRLAPASSTPPIIWAPIAQGTTSRAFPSKCPPVSMACTPAPFIAGATGTEIAGCVIRFNRVFFSPSADSSHPFQHPFTSSRFFLSTHQAFMRALFILSSSSSWVPNETTFSALQKPWFQLTSVCHSAQDQEYCTP